MYANLEQLEHIEIKERPNLMKLVALSSPCLNSRTVFGQCLNSPQS